MEVGEISYGGREFSVEVAGEVERNDPAGNRVAVDTGPGAGIGERVPVREKIIRVHGDGRFEGEKGD